MQTRTTSMSNNITLYLGGDAVDHGNADAIGAP